MNRQFVLLFAVLVSACAGQTPSEHAARLRIATWNLEHLAEHVGAGCHPRTDADYALLASYAAKLDADVIGLQEVENEAAAHRVFPSDQYDIVMSGQRYSEKQGPCGQGGVQTFTPQRTGYAIRKGVAYTVNPPLEALNVAIDRDRPVRWGVDVTLSGPIPIRLLDVHLKSGCSAGADPKNGACPMLFSQVSVVEGWIDARERDGLPFIVLGDFNRRLGPDDAQVWQMWDDGDPPGLKLVTAAGAADAGPVAPRCEGGKYKEFIDHIVFSERALPLYEPSSFGELVYAETGDAAPSDHCAISVLLRH